MEEKVSANMRLGEINKLKKNVDRAQDSRNHADHNTAFLNKQFSHILQAIVLGNR